MVVVPILYLRTSRHLVGAQQDGTDLRGLARQGSTESGNLQSRGTEVADVSSEGGRLSQA